MDNIKLKNRPPKRRIRRRCMCMRSNSFEWEKTHDGNPFVIKINKISLFQIFLAIFLSENIFDDAIGK